MIYNIKLDEVQDVIYDAVRAACRRLDEKFPGGDARGINSLMAYEIEKTIKRLLIERGPCYEPLD